VTDKQLVDPSGRPVKRAPVTCPKCGAGKDRRINTAGFGEPVFCCGGCGHHYEGVKE
jgi:hypothetical protein